MTPNQAISIQALLVALAQFDGTLTPMLLEAVQRIGDSLAHGKPEAIDHIPNIARQQPHLQQLYRLAWVVLERYPDRPDAGEQMFVPAAEADALTQLAALVLRDPNPVTQIQAQLRQIKMQLDLNHGADVPRLLERLYEAALEVNAETIAVLRALERRPLTIENLCYALQLSADQVKEVVQYLWNVGYISTTDHALPRLFSLWRRRSTTTATYRSASTHPPSGEPQFSEDFPAYFTLTAKGHFYLHPLITAGPREGFP